MRVLPLLDQHVPVGHLDGGNRDVRPAGDGRHPVERHRQLPGGEERTIAFVQAVDRQVLDEELAGEETDPERPDVHRPLDVLGALDFRLLSRDRSEIDRDGRDDRRRQQRDDQREAEADTSKGLVMTQALEGFH